MSDPTLAEAAELGQAGLDATDVTPLTPVEDGAPPGRARGLYADAWRDLRRRPLFIIAGFVIVILVLMAAFPSLFTNTDPRAADLSKSLAGPESGHPFGFDRQGYDVYARAVYGARASIVVGFSAVIGNTLLGGFAGVTAGYVGGWLDSIISRVGDIFLGLPFVLGGIVLLSTFAGAQSNAGPVRITLLVILALIMLGWPTFTRIIRSSVISSKSQDYVQAARALGASPRRIVFRHVLPNSLASILVLATISLGTYIGAEATLSYLGVGLRPPVISWGIMIAASQPYVAQQPLALLIPSAFLVATVLSFVMLGDAVRDALDPKLR